MIYVDKYEIKKIDKKGNVKFEAKSDEGMASKCFMRLLDDMEDGICHYGGVNCEVKITFKEENEH